MSAEQNKAIVRREVEELYNPDGPLDAVYDIYSPNYILHDPSLPEGDVVPNPLDNLPPRSAAPSPTFIPPSMTRLPKWTRWRTGGRRRAARMRASSWESLLLAIG